MTIMKPRYAQGNGKPPIYVASISREREGKGAFIFAGEGGVNQTMPFASAAEFLKIFNVLLAKSVPLSVGGHCVGPADEVGQLILRGDLQGPYVEISWSGPEKWTIREIGNGPVPWEEVADPSLIADMLFNPDEIKHAG